MSNKPQPDWDPQDTAVVNDQAHAYDELRERCPVAHSDAMGWSVFRHADVQSIARDTESFSNASRHHAIPNALDGPEHSRNRRALEAFFTDEHLARAAACCREAAGDATATLLEPSPADAVAGFAEPVAIHTMIAFLGWRPETFEPIRHWLHANAEATSEHDRHRMRELADNIAGMVRDEIARHRDGEFDDVTSGLMHLEVDGRAFTETDILDTLRTWIAGHGTVAAGIGNLVHRLASDQDLQRQLREQPEVIPAAVDEILRIDGPLVANRRSTTRDVTILGREIPRGERVSLMWIAANRDGRAFPEPEAVRLDRDGENLLFGTGIHYCLGAPLARLEMRIALEELLARTSSVELDTSRATVRQTWPGNGFNVLPVRVA